MSKGLPPSVVAGDCSHYVLVSAHAYLMPQWLGCGVHLAPSVDCGEACDLGSPRESRADHCNEATVLSQSRKKL